jgi:hypothetical protein
MGSAAGAAVGNKLFGGGQNTNVPVGLASATGGRADGGVIHPEGHATSQGPGTIVGPGTDISDSIDAVNVDTGQAIKLSNNEYIIPADVVRMKGREFFDRMVQKYHTPAAKQAIQRAA